MIENQEFPETLLRLMKFIIEILDESRNSFASTRINTKGYESPINSPRNLQCSYKKNIENYQKPLKNYQKSPESSQKLSCWTQTLTDDNNVSFKSRPKVHITDLVDDKADKIIQTTFENPKPENRTNSASKQRLGQVQINKSIQVSNNNTPLNSVLSPTSLGINETSSFRRISSVERLTKPKLSPSPQIDSKHLISLPEISREYSLKSTSELKPINIKGEEDYLKLIDESKYLLDIIDKQNSRLSKINNQISQLVPNSIEISEHKDNEEISRNTERNPGDYTNDGTRLQLISSVLEKNSDSDERINGEKSPKNERKRSGWDFSALRIPAKEPIDSKRPDVEIKRAASPRRLEKQSDGKIINDRSRSPDPNSDRFRGYTRPLLKEEDCWGSVADFFGGGPPSPSKSKDFGSQ